MYWQNYLCRQIFVKIFVALLLVQVPFVAVAQDRSGEAAPAGFSDLPPPCGNMPISIANLQWPSTALLAHIHAQILTKQYGCEVEIVASDPAAATSSMATISQPSVAPEMWISRISELWNSAVESQKIRKAGSSFSGSPLEGWFIPDYIAKNHPALTSAESLKDYWQVFQKNGAKAKFVSCPQEWACSIINANLLKALGLDGLFEIIVPGDRFELDNLIGGAVSRREPILFYYWQPNSVLAQFDFLQLDMGDYDSDAMACLAKKECNDPRPSAFAPEPVVIILADRVFTEAPQIAAYFQRARMPIDEMNSLLALQSEGGKTIEELAGWFIEQRAEIWQKWIGN